MIDIKNLLDYRKTCPVCDKDLSYEIGFSPSSVFSMFNNNTEILDNLEEEILSFKKGKRTLRFKKFPFKMLLNKNLVELIDIENNPDKTKIKEKLLFGVFCIRGVCKKEIIGDEYSFISTFYCSPIGGEVISLRNGNDIKFIFTEFKFKERLVVISLEEKIGGFHASILNDLNNKETIFNLSTIDFENPNKNNVYSHKNKLLEKDFFNYKDAKNVISRMRSMMLLRDNSASC